MASAGETPAAQNGELEWLSDYVINFLKSPTWVTPIAQFVDERCIVFDAEEENKLEYTTCHQEFKHLIDGLFAAHLLEVNISHEQFQGFCQNGLMKSPQLHKVLIQQLLSIDDFLIFKAMMVKRNADLYREVLKRMVDGNEGSADVDTSLDLGETIFEVGEEDKATKDLVSSEWQFYEDQLFKNLRSPEETERLEAQRRCEEAELEQAIALSLQAEEERLRQLDAEEEALKEATAASMDVAACEATTPAPVEAPTASAPLTSAVEAPVAPAPAAAAPTPVAATPAPVAAAPAAAAVPLTAPSTLAPLKSALPRLMRVEPLNSRPPLPPAPAQAAAAAAAGGAVAAPSQAAGERHVEVAQQRQRAQRAMAMPAASGPAVPPPVPARPEPTEEERKARAEHLRRQRELLVTKRNQERERKLQEFQQSRRAADSALSSTSQAAPAGDAGKRLVAELMPSGAPAVPAQDVNAAAVQMRQALNAQLRQTLSRSVSSNAGALDDQISRLEQMKLR